jgi:predicted RNA-binding protein with PIN domain
LIDGYNLLHATGLFGRGGRNSLHASRQALLGFLAAAIDKTERAATTVVFDATHAPPGLPHIHTVAGITVHFAQQHASADELLEELIAADHSPKKLVVVSSDHRLQRAAKKRRATAIDSHVWYGEVDARLRGRRGKRYAELPDVKPNEQLSPSEVQAWLRIFGPIDESESTLTPRTHPKKIATKKPPPADKRADSPANSASPAKRPRRKAPVPSEEAVPRKKKIKNLGFGDVESPFPPGYGEDLQK